MSSEISIPFPAGKQKSFKRFWERVRSASKIRNKNEEAERFSALRMEVTPSEETLLATQDLEHLVCCNVLLDLVSHGWNLSGKANSLYVSLRSNSGSSIEEQKAAVRKGHLMDREAQLQERAVREFIVSMERRRLSSRGWHSIFSVMRDGSDLAKHLVDAAAIGDTAKREKHLAKHIQPYLQFVDGEERCAKTGLFLKDIWRYFRHTWVNSYQSLPGRSVQILIRDAAGPNHPVIGIAALGSSIIQQSMRDEWIGWTPSVFLRRLAQGEIPHLAKWLVTTVDRLLTGIYVDDLIADGLLDSFDLLYPSEPVLTKLIAEAERMTKRHRLYPRAAEHKSQQVSNGAVSWEIQAKTSLFRAKRCRVLVDILNVRRCFQDLGFDGNSGQLKGAMLSPAFSSAVSQILRMVKAEHAGIDMMDIIVCGAVAPYNHILGGKLVCMMLCSPEITAHYLKKYAGHTSVIASSMKGAPVNRVPKLSLLCTTSLYGVGSSQYNRVKIPVAEIGGNSAEAIEYQALGQSKGFGSYHLSSLTTRLMKVFLARKHNSRRVNFIFGEGVNPKLRNLREALDLVGLPSDQILNHAKPRVIYGVPLAKNFREVLLGLAKTPKYLIPQSRAQDRTSQIVSYWRRRWLVGRVMNEQIIENVRAHTLSYPVVHGARVSLPTGLDEEDRNYYGELAGDRLSKKTKAAISSERTSSRRK